MKKRKITRKDLVGLRQLYPVLSKEEMRRYVAGGFAPYNEHDWLLSNPYALNMMSADMGEVGSVASGDEGDVKNDLWASDWDMELFSKVGYPYGSYGYYGWDMDGGELDEVVIYGGYYDNYYYNVDDTYPDEWWNDGHWGWGDSDGMYDYGMYDHGTDDSDDRISNGNDCVAYTVSHILARYGSNISEDEVFSWIETNYGVEGINSDNYFAVMSHFFYGDPVYGIVDEKYNSLEDRSVCISVVVGHPQQSTWHSGTLFAVDGTDVWVVDDQNGGIFRCSIMDIRKGYRITGVKN